MRADQRRAPLYAARLRFFAQQPGQTSKQGRDALNALPKPAAPAGRANPLLSRYETILKRQELVWVSRRPFFLPGNRRAGNRLLEPAARGRRFSAACRAQNLFARALRERHRLRNRDGAARLGRRPRRANSAGQPGRRAQLHQASRHPPARDGMGRRLRLAAPLPVRPLGPHRRHRHPRPLGPHQQAHRDLRQREPAPEAGHRRLHLARLPGGSGRPAPRGHRARRPQAVEHHAQADRQHENHRRRLGVRFVRFAPVGPLHAGLRRAGSSGRPARLAAVGPGELGVRAARNAHRRPTLLDQEAVRRTVARKSRFCNGCRGCCRPKRLPTASCSSS